ncbi:MAG: glycosyltransferase family 4 protein [Burkholderiales bacterium]|nr:glycosyltransferase family 4 protein [Burkholderiales bacterium]
MSFELEIPRYLGEVGERAIRFGLDRMSSKRCRKLLALSDFAKRHALRVFAKHGYEHLGEKLEVFRGGVWDPFASGYSRPSQAEGQTEGPLTAIVIGTQLFRKGGMYAIEAFERLRARGMDVRLTLVGDFESRCYAFRDGLPSRDEWRKRAASLDWVTMMPPVPFAEVYRLLLSHDVCLYASLDESLGWLPIEAAMAGKPMIGARVAAFPEFVHHDETGYLIDVPVGESERWEGLFLSGQSHLNALAEVHEKMVAGIGVAMEMIYNDRSLATKWGDAGRTLMRQMYDMQAAGLALEQIYDEALNSRQ